MIQHLINRSLININGLDAVIFLQKMLTVDISILQSGQAQFSAFLSPQGKILFDFFIIATENGFLIDIDQCMCADFCKKLLFYRLRSRVNINPMNDGYRVYALWKHKPENYDGVCILDPRLNELGLRLYSKNIYKNDCGDSDYLGYCIQLGIPTGGIDYIYGDTFPHEALLDQVNAISFSKGCYVGQEVVSRVHHRANVRKRIIKIQAQQYLSGTGQEIFAGEKVIGRLGSVSGYQGLAMMRLDKVTTALCEKKEIKTASNISVIPELQDWVDFKWPER